MCKYTKKWKKVTLGWNSFSLAKGVTTTHSFTVLTHLAEPSTLIFENISKSIGLLDWNVSLGLNIGI